MPKFNLGIIDAEQQAADRATVYGEPTAPAPDPLTHLPKKDREEARNAQAVTGMLLKHKQASREREILRDQNYMQSTGLGTISPNENYEFEQSRDHEAEVRRQDFRRNDPEAAFLQPDNASFDPDEDSFDPAETLNNVVNFLFSDEMGLMGLKWDGESYDWNKQNFVQQITEHPYSTAFTLASYIVPVGLAWRKGARIAERGARLAAGAGADAAVSAGKGFLGTSLGFKFDDHAKLVQTLAMPEANDARRLFSDETASALKKATSPDEIKDIVSPRELNKMLISDFHQDRYYELRNLAKDGKLEGIRQKASYAMWNRFGNKYFQQLQDISKHHIDSMDEFFVKAQLGRYLSQAPTRLGDAGEKAIYKFWLEGTGRSKEELGKKIGTENADWAESIAGKWTELFTEQASEGFIDDATVALFSNKGVGAGFHLPALKKGTPGAEEIGGKISSVTPGQYGQLVESRGLDVAKALGGPTTKHRGKFTTKQAVLDNLDELETNPSKLTVGGFIKDNVLFQIHRNFRDIVVEGAEGNAKWAQAIRSREAYEAMPKAAQKHWLNFDELDSVVPGLSSRMERMVQNKVAKEGLDPAKHAVMPVIDREIVNQFFGRDGSARQVGGAFGRFFELMTAVHKTSRTALNVPTHMSNVTGNMMFLAMAGMNPFGRQALNDGRLMTKTFVSVAKQLKNKSDETIDTLMTKDRLTDIMGKNRFTKDKMGNKIDLAELFSDPVMKDLIEAQAFDQVEGLQNVNRLLESMEHLDGSGWGDKALESTARAIAGIGQTPGIKGTLHVASSAYLAEDMVPKMMYAMNLARKGWGKDAIVREIGRRLPQYRTVGQIPAEARRVVLPWITFPAEATRIMKNNMMDRPVQMMAWMQAPQIAQSMVSGMGMGPDFKDYEDAMNAAPGWAHRYQTVLMDGNEAPEVMGAIGAAGVGGVVGAAAGGAPGAAVGAAVGAVGGAAIGAAFGKEQDELREFNRAWTMDFLPQSAMFPSSTHPGEWEKLLPTSMGGVPTPGVEAFHTAKDLTPVEPFAVFLPLLELYSGRGSFGQEIQAKSGIDFAGKAALGLLGHLSPPIMQKYGMKLDGPGLNPIAMADIFENNGGQSTLPKAITATMGGLAMGGLSFLGARKGLGAAKGAAAAAGLISGTVGAGAGSQVNVERLMKDLGIKPDTRTGQYGDWTMDFLANSFFGLNKSWKADATQAEYNQTLREKRFAELRKVSVKEYRDAISAGHESRAKATLAEIKKTYVYEHGDTQIADREFIEWAKRTHQSMGNLPIFAGISEEKLLQRIVALRAANGEKTKMQRQRIAELRAELQRRQLSKVGGLKVVGQ